MSPQNLSQARDHRIDWLQSLPFFAAHAIAFIAPFFVPFAWKYVALAGLSYYVRMFGVTGGFHRYFSHRSYKTSRIFQFMLAWLAMTSTQKGVLWWAGHHRHHHKYSDQPEDLHSVQQDGFWWSHVGWILSPRYEATPGEQIKDFSKFPELVWLNRYHLLPGVSYAMALFFIGGGSALVWGYFVSTVMLWHGTFTINSLSHVFGRRRYATSDNSRNSLALALITMGEGWHNNHHYYQSTANQGWYWWEIDCSYYVLKFLSRIGLVWDLRTPPSRVRDAREAEVISPALPLSSNGSVI